MIFSTLQNFHKHASSWRPKKLPISRFFEVYHVAYPVYQAVYAVYYYRVGSQQNKNNSNTHDYLVKIETL